MNGNAGFRAFIECERTWPASVDRYRGVHPAAREHHWHHRGGLHGR